MKTFLVAHLRVLNVNHDFRRIIEGQLFSEMKYIDYRHSLTMSRRIFERISFTWLRSSLDDDNDSLYYLAWRISRGKETASFHFALDVAAERYHSYFFVHAREISMDQWYSSTLYQRQWFFFSSSLVLL